MGMNSAKTEEQGTSVTGKRDQQSKKGKCSTFTMGRKINLIKKKKNKKEWQGRTLIEGTVWMQENTQRTPHPAPAIRMTVLLCGTEQ